MKLNIEDLKTEWNNLIDKKPYENNIEMRNKLEPIINLFDEVLSGYNLSDRDIMFLRKIKTLKDRHNKEDLVNYNQMAGWYKMKD